MGDGSQRANPEYVLTKVLDPSATVAKDYQVTIFTTSKGRTLGGIVAGTRVVAVDGSRPSIGQSLVRLLALPWAGLRMRAAHDEIAATEVIAD